MNPPDFQSAFQRTMVNEGYLILENVPGDNGGETFSGISRRFNPTWPGWVRVDVIKNQPYSIATALKNDKVLEVLVQEFYRANYWIANHCDEMIDQSIAAEVFDMAVNCGSGQASQYFQRALNASFEPNKYFAPLLVDGAIGPSTIDALALLLAHETAQEFTNALNAFAAKHYLELAEKGEQKFFRGWLRRVAILPLTRS